MTKRFPLLALLFVMACSGRSSDVRNTAAKGGAAGDPDAGEGGKPAATQGNGGSGGADPRGNGGSGGADPGTGGVAGNGGYPPFTSCGTPQCPPVTWMLFALPGNYAATRASTAKVCRGDRCTTVPLATLPEQGPAAGQFVRPAVIPQGDDTLDLIVWNATVDYRLDVSWSFPRPDLGTRETYTITVTDENERALVLEQTAEYVRKIQASDCEPLCARAEFGLTGSAVCCPRDAQAPAAELYMGGRREDGHCSQTFDFFCTANFRVESDGVCQRWAYDNVPCPDGGF